MSSDYQLLDSGNQLKVEKIGKYKLIRPCPQAIWEPFKPELWANPDSTFVREKGEKGLWKGVELPQEWEIQTDNKIKWTIQPNEYGNLGIFSDHWTYSEGLEDFFYPDGQVLNLFSYSGSSVLPLLKAGYKITSVDSSKSAMNLYTKNLALNKISREGQRLILEDVIKFCKREIRRKTKYESLIADVPSFGRGNKGEVFDIDEQFKEVLLLCKELLTSKGRVVLTFHSPRYTIEGLKIILNQVFSGKKVEAGEILNPCVSGVNLPSGFLAKIC